MCETCEYFIWGQIPKVYKFIHIFLFHSIKFYIDHLHASFKLLINCRTEQKITNFYTLEKEKGAICTFNIKPHRILISFCSSSVCISNNKMFMHTCTHLILYRSSDWKRTECFSKLLHDRLSKENEKRSFHFFPSSSHFCSPTSTFKPWG